MKKPKDNLNNLQDGLEFSLHKRENKEIMIKPRDKVSIVAIIQLILENVFFPISSIQTSVIYLIIWPLQILFKIYYCLM